MLLNQQHQSDVDGITPMPVDRVDDSSVVKTTNAETITWLFNDSGAWGSAIGEAAGTVCVAKLTYTGILNSNGSAIGHYGDTSLSFAATTRASTLIKVPEEAFSKMLKMTVVEKVAYIITWLNTNGDYAVDHRRGEVWLLSKDTVADDATTYKYCSPISSGAVGSEVIITDGTDDAAVLGRTTGTEQPANSDNALVVYDVGGGAASVSSQYRATSNGQDGTCVYASASTLTLSGLPFTVNTEDLVYVKEVDATGNTAAVFVNGAGGVHLEISSGVITKSGGSDFSSDGVYELGYNGQNKAYSAPTDSNQTTRLNPDWEQLAPSTIADVTNGADDTYNYYVDMEGYRKGNFTLDLDGGSGTVTVKVYGTMQDDGTAAASCTYFDIGNDVFGAVSWTADAVLIDDGEALGCFKYIKVEVVASTAGADDADWTIQSKKLY